MWSTEPTHSYKYSLNPGELYAMVASCDTNPVVLKTESHNGYNVTFKLYPCLDSNARQVTLCAEVTPSESCPNLSVKVEAVVTDPSGSPLGHCVSDERSIYSSSLKNTVSIFLRNMMTHCRLFYSCRKHEHLDFHIRCWERFDDSMITDSGVDIMQDNHLRHT